MRTSIFWFFSPKVDRQSGSAIEFDGINPSAQSLQAPALVVLSAGLGYAFNGSLFVAGGPAVSVMRGLALPLRIGVAVTPQGTTFLVNPGVLFIFNGLTLGVDFGHVVPDSVIVGVGLGINWPPAPQQPGTGDDP